MRRIRKTAPVKERRQRELDTYDTDVIDLPWLPEVERVVVIPLKTIYRNVSAADLAGVQLVVRRLDTGIGLQIASQIEAM